MKKEVLEQIKWYFSLRKKFNFDGKPFEEVVFDRNGIDGVTLFYNVDSRGKRVLKPTRHPNIYQSLMKTKSSINLHIKMYAEDRAKGILPKIEFEKICEEINAPKWFIDAVENQKNRYYEKPHNI
jgi:hypothetical protein